MYWVLPGTLETIDLDQLKDMYWKPGLLGMVMRGEKLPKAPLFPMDKLHPTAEVIPPKPGQTTAKIKLARRSGGIGDVTLTVNGRPVEIPKERIQARAAKQEIEIDLRDYIVPGQEISLEAITSNTDKSLTGRSIVAKWTPKETRKTNGDLYILAVGVDQYGGDLQSLRYPGIDAAEFANAAEIGGKRLFEKVHARVLAQGSTPLPPSSDTNIPRRGSPSREHITDAFLWLQQNAKPEDTVLVFLAGHGATIKKGTKDLYCFLTEGATGATLAEDDLITQDDLKAWTNPKKLKALRCAMILDTCASGELVEGMSARDGDRDAVKLIDRAKDETGFWILAGSAADAASYETAAYGHGLLTYALLNALKGDGLDEKDGSAWIHTLFTKAKERVQQEANLRSIKQQPNIFAQNSPFPIGILDKGQREMIVLQQPLPTIGRTKDFLDTTEQPFYDRLELSILIRKKLRDAFEASPRGKASFVYSDSDSDPSALIPSGSYRRAEDKIVVTLLLLQGGKPLNLGDGKEAIEITAQTKEEAAELIAKRVAELAAAIRPAKDGG